MLGDIAADLRTPEIAVVTAKRRVEECAKALCTQAAREGRGGLAGLETRVDVLKHHIWDLEAVRDYPQTGRWPPHCADCSMIPRPRSRPRRRPQPRDDRKSPAATL
jgi:hypothetical protein